MIHQHSYISAIKVFKIFISSIFILVIFDIIGEKIIKEKFINSDYDIRNILNKKKSDLLIFGSSTTARAFDPNIFDKKLKTNGYTFASDGTGIFYATSLLRQIPEDIRVKYIIFGIDPQSFISGYSSNNFKQIERLTPYAKKDPILMNFLRIDDEWIDFKMISLSYPYISQVKEILKDDARNFLNGENRKNTKNFRSLNGSLIRESESKNFENDFINEDNIKISVEAIHALELIKEQMNKKDFKLVIVTTPIFNTNLRSVQQKYKNVMEAIRKILKNDNLCDLTLIETQEMKNITKNPGNFYDGPHLNSIGAIKFSKEIAKAISLDCNY